MTALYVYSSIIVYIVYEITNRKPNDVANAIELLEPFKFL